MADDMREASGGIHAEVPELEVRNLCKYFPAGKGRVLKPSTASIAFKGNGVRLGLEY